MEGSTKAQGLNPFAAQDEGYSEAVAAIEERSIRLESHSISE